MENKSAALQETPYDEIKSFFDSAPPLRDGVSISKKFQQFIETKSSSSGDSRNKRYFLKAGYSVIFLYRRGSYQPYCTSLPDDPLLECLELTDESSIQVHPSHSDAVKKAIAEHQAAVKGGHLLKLPFTTIFEYLQILRSISISMKTVDRSAMFYLAAAMFGFYVPWDSMAVHKIQSASGPLDMRLVQVPKMLLLLRSEWAPAAFFISFMLETDMDILLKKANMALKKYKMHTVVANELLTRKEEVTVVTSSGNIKVRRDKIKGTDVESLLIKLLVEKHLAHIDDSSKSS